MSKTGNRRVYCIFVPLHYRNRSWLSHLRDNTDLFTSAAFCNSCWRKPWSEGKRVKNSRAVILFSMECSSCTLFAPNILSTKAENNSVAELRTYTKREYQCKHNICTCLAYRPQGSRESVYSNLHSFRNERNDMFPQLGVTVQSSQDVQCMNRCRMGLRGSRVITRSTEVTSAFLTANQIAGSLVFLGY